MKRLVAMLAIAAFLGSCLAASPALALDRDTAPDDDHGSSSLAGEVLIGIVTRGWTDAQCEAEFGKSVVKADPGDDAIYPAESRGPLKSEKRTPPIQTGCYCSEQPTGQGSTHYIMNAKGTGCDLCKQYDTYAVHLADEELRPIDSSEAAIMVKDSEGEEIDRGCRCAERENFRFTGVEDNKCKYVETSKEDAACVLEFGKGSDSGAVKSCTGAAGELYIGDAKPLKTGETPRCCCAEGTEAVPLITGTMSCKKIAEGDLDKYDLACMQAAAGYSTDPKGAGIIQCPDYLLQDDSRLSDEQKAEKKKSFINVFSTTEGSQICCCDLSREYVLDPKTGKCVSQKDECTKVVAGSVKGGHPEASTIKVGDVYNGKAWDKEIPPKIKTAGLAACFCKIGFNPSDDDADDLYETCTSVPVTCGTIFPGSVESTSTYSTGGKKIEGTLWDAARLQQAVAQPLECWCPNGTTPMTIDADPDLDACGLVDPDCMTTQDLADFMKVGVCYAREAGGDSVPILFTDPVIITGSEGAGIENRDVSSLSKFFKSAGYGLSRASGLRDLGYMFKGKCTEPAKNAGLPSFIDYAQCLAKFDCDKMPGSDEGWGGAKVVVGVYLALRTPVALAAMGTPEIIKEMTTLADGVGKPAKKAAKTAGDVGKLAQDVIPKLDAAVIKLAAYEKRLKFLNGELTKAPPISYALQQAYSAEAASLSAAEIAAKGEAAQIVSEFKMALNQKTVTLADAKTLVSQADTALTDAQDTLKAFRIDTSTSGAALGKALGDQSKAAKDGVTAADTIVTAANNAGDADALLKALRPPAGVIPEIGEAVGATAGVAKGAATATTESKKAAQATKITSRLAEYIKGKVPTGWAASVKGNPVVKQGNSILKALYKNPITQGIVKVAKTAGRGLNAAAWVYSAGDGLSAGITYGFTGQVTINPGDMMVQKTKVLKPFSIKPASGNNFPGIKNMEFVSTGTLLGNKLFDGSVLDISWEASIEKPPDGVTGYTYKCTGTCNSCSNNRMMGCKCYPVNEEVEMEYAKATSTAGTTLGMMI